MVILMKFKWCQVHWRGGIFSFDSMSDTMSKWFGWYDKLVSLSMALFMTSSVSQAGVISPSMTLYFCRYFLLLIPCLMVLLVQSCRYPYLIGGQKQRYYE